MEKIAEGRTGRSGNQLTSSAFLKEKTYVNNLLREVFKYVPLERSTKVFEVGCGKGRFSRCLNELCSLAVMDVNVEHFDLTAAQDCCQMDVRSLALADKCSDIAFCHAVLHHLEELEQAAAEMARIAAEYLVIIEPNPLHIRNALMALFDPEEKQLRRYSIQRIKDSAETCGFRQITTFSVGFFAPRNVPDFLMNQLLKLKFHQPFGWDQVLIMKRAEKPALV